MESTKQLLFWGLEEIKKNSLLSNFLFGFILFGFEKIMEMEFACPCNSVWNLWFAAAFFTIPALTVFLVTCLMYKHLETSDSYSKVCFNSLIHAVLWVILLFIDGRYYVCLKTPWLGEYEIMQSASSLRWCRPDNSSHESVIQTQEWYSVSQLIGVVMGLVLIISCMIYRCCSKYCCKKKSTDQRDVQ